MLHAQLTSWILDSDLVDVPGNTPGGLMTSHKYNTVYNIPEGVLFTDSVKRLKNDTCFPHSGNSTKRSSRISLINMTENLLLLITAFMCVVQRPTEKLISAKAEKKKWALFHQSNRNDIPQNESRLGA